MTLSAIRENVYSNVNNNKEAAKPKQVSVIRCNDYHLLIKNQDMDSGDKLVIDEGPSSPRDESEEEDETEVFWFYKQ